MRYRIFIFCLLLFALSRVEAQNSDSPTAPPKTKTQVDASSKDQSQSTIKIDLVKPDSAAATESIAIVGSGFGDSGTVTIHDQKANFTSWSDTSIVAIVPDGLPT